MSGRIATVLRVRAVQERQALGRLALARRAVCEAEAEVADRVRGYEQRPQPPALRDGSGALLSPAALLAYRLQGQGALERVAEARALRDEAAAHERQRADAWSAASVARKSAERLAERHRLAEEAAERTREAAALDELVVLQRGGS